jgi:hypothetical protein
MEDTITKAQNIIEYKGYTYKTSYDIHCTDEMREHLKALAYKKPSLKSVATEIYNLYNGGSSTVNIEKYFYRDLMYKTKLYCSHWTVEDVFECNEVLGYFLGLIKAHPNFFSATDSLVEQVFQAIRLGGGHVARKPTNFPIKTMDYMLSKYNINNNYYDFSCGWGIRLASSLRNRINYFGTDPNYLLVERLNEFGKLYKYTTNDDTTSFKIYCQGSEVDISELHNKIGLAFSSPPYFHLEDYQIGNQSYKEGVSYDEWLNGYMRGTVKNIHNYLIDYGIFGMNVKDYDKYSLEADVKQVIEESDFSYIGNERLENIKRISNSGNGELLDNSEKIMIFTKKGFEDNKRLNNLSENKPIAQKTIQKKLF